MSPSTISPLQPSPACNNEAAEELHGVPRAHPLAAAPERTIDVSVGSAFVLRVRRQTLKVKLEAIALPDSDLIELSVEYRDARARVLTVSLMFAAGKTIGFAMGDVSFFATAFPVGSNAVCVRLHSFAQLVTA
jgi:hypothetical protein